MDRLDLSRALKTLTSFRRKAMRFIVMHKVDAHMEAAEPPNQEIIERMGALVQGSLKDGVFLNGAGLHRSARRARLRHAGGDVSVTMGPYQGQNELIASFVMISAASLDGAIGHARRLASALGDCEIEVGPVVEPWDLGLMPKPSGAPERFLLLCKASAEDERERGAAAKHRAAVKKLSEGFQNDGAVLAADSLAPSSTGSRSGPTPGKRTWVDGPFAESKELIAGFSLLELPSKADALAWADRYAAILIENEIDVREVHDSHLG
jgi:hypothetical protein